MRTLDTFLRETDTKQVVAPQLETCPEGLVIEEIEMNRFMRYLKTTDPPLRFPHQFTAITGPTGSGKTTILDAITFALYKRTSRTDLQSVKISDVCQNGGHVRILFHQGGHLYMVKRGFDSKGRPYVQLTKDGQPITGTIPELDATIQEIIGLDYDGFRNSTFVRQEEMKELGAESGAKRLEIFQKLFRLEIFEKAQSRAKERFSEAELEIKGLEERIAYGREMVAKIPELEERVKESRKTLKSLGKKLDKMQSEITEREEKLKVLEREHERFLKLLSAVETKESQLKDVKRRLEETSKKREESSSIRAEIKELETVTQDYDSLQEEGERLRELSQKHALISKDLETAQKRMSEAEQEWSKKRSSYENRILSEQERLRNLSTDIDSEEAFRLLRQEGALEERVSRIDLEKEWLSDQEDLLRRIEREQKEASTALDKVRERIGGINEDSFVMTEIQKGIERLEQEMAEEERSHQERITSLQKEIQTLESELKKVGFGKGEMKKLNEIRERIADLRKKRERLEKLRKEIERIGDLSKVIEDLEAQRERLERELERLRKDLEKTERDEERYKALKVELEKLRNERESLSREVGGLEGEIRSLEEQIENLRKEEERIGESEKELEKARSRAEVYSLLKDTIFHKKGVVMFAIEQLLPELQIETSRNLSDLTDGRFSRVKLETVEENRAYGIRIAVQGVDGEWHDVGEFSGGERTQINAALRFAIAKELASMPQVGRTFGRMRTLFIDEGDLGSLDTEASRELFVQKLFKMGEFFEKVILITHLTEVAERFPGRIRVEMTPAQESRIEVLA